MLLPQRRVRSDSEKVRHKENQGNPSQHLALFDPLLKMPSQILISLLKSREGRKQTCGSKRWKDVFVTQGKKEAENQSRTLQGRVTL